MAQEGGAHGRRGELRVPAAAAQSGGQRNAVRAVPRRLVRRAGHVRRTGGRHDRLNAEGDLHGDLFLKII